MGNIVLRLFTVLVYIVICLVFSLSPYMGGRGKKFGVKVEKGSVYVLKNCLIYTFVSILSAAAFVVVCIVKNSFGFTNISVFLYIVFMTSIYLKIRQELKAAFAKGNFGEIIINNPPEEYLLKMINPCFYWLYLVPIIISFFIGRTDAYFVCILSIQSFIAMLSFALNVLICRFKNYVDDNVEKSINKNLKYRKMWNVNVFFTLLSLSASISLMYAEYKNVIYIAGLGEWLPFIVICVSVGILIFYSFIHYKK